jgi:hypothetical protein
MKERTWDGADLLTVKDKRNALAHGFQSYEDVGRDYPARELLRMTRRSLAYVGEILKNVSTYLDGREYTEALNSTGDIRQDVLDDSVTDGAA